MVKIDKVAFNLLGLIQFPTKTVQKRVKIEKVDSICMVWKEFLQKPFKNGSKLKRLLQFVWSCRISYKNHPKTVKIEKVASICVVW